MLGVGTMMRVSGSNRLAEEARSGSSAKEAIEIAKKCFCQKWTLLLIDDVWEESDCGRDIAVKVSRVADIKSGSGVVFSSRDMRMTARSEEIRFRARRNG